MRRYWFLVLLIFVFFVKIGVVDAFRIPRPPVFSLPLNQDQINQLNDTLENMWNLQNGEFNFDVVTAIKTGANNGDLWLLQTGNTTRIQYKWNNTIFTVTPDGY